MATRPTTELDFDQLKADIITFIKTNPTYSDYAFEGSALNAIIDVLAYNTHNNAYIANMLHAESFIDSAQKRGSVVSRAKELGYRPKSATCSSAIITIVANDTTPNIIITLSRGDSFTSSNDIGTYSFAVLENISGSVSGTTHTFSGVKIVNGIRVQNYFTVDTTQNVRSIFSIPNENIDTETLKVYVRDSISSIGKVEYTLAESIYDLNAESKSYFLQESHDGLFQIYFGNDILGKQPVNGNVIDIDYFVTTAVANSNGCLTFNSANNIGQSHTITTNQSSFGGSDKESINSIKFNSIKTNSSRNRAVTVLDYASIIKAKYSFIQTVSVWGGEDNNPPTYGKIFVSLQPATGYTISDDVKNNIIAKDLKAISVMTMGIEFVDPTYIDLHFITNLKFNSAKTTSSKLDVVSLVKATILNYISSIAEFNKDYIESTLTSLITQSDPGIVGVTINKQVGFKISPPIGIELNFQKNVGNKILKSSIKSTRFTVVAGTTPTVVYIKEIPDKFSTFTNSTTVVIHNAIGLYSLNDTLIKEIGYVNLDTGEFNFSVSVFSYLTANKFIDITFDLVNDDIYSIRNQIIQLSQTIIDPTIGIIDNNQVSVESYDK